MSRNWSDCEPQGYYVIVHGVNIHIDGTKEWQSLDEAKDIADSFLSYGFHSIEVRQLYNNKIEHIYTIKDWEEL
jgi:hypothetical protein